MKQAAEIHVVEPSGRRGKIYLTRTLFRQTEVGDNVYSADLPSIYTAAGLRVVAHPDGYQIGEHVVRPATLDDQFDRILARLNRQAREQGLQLV